MIRHIVAMRFKAGTPDAVKADIYAALAGMSGHIDGILDFRTFRNVSPEAPVVHGFEDLFWFDFRDAAVRDAYLIDPVHQAIGGRIVAATEGGVEGILVLDVVV
jgi:hypothetical protein